MGLDTPRSNFFLTLNHGLRTFWKVHFHHWKTQILKKLLLGKQFLNPYPSLGWLKWLMNLLTNSLEKFGMSGGRPSYIQINEWYENNRLLSMEAFIHCVIYVIYVIRVNVWCGVVRCESDCYVRLVNWSSHLARFSIFMFQIIYK